jgi:hypothetical protein
MEPITTAISIVLSKIVLDKFYEGVSSNLGEKVVEKALAPIEKLGQLLWDRCFKGKPGTDDLAVQAEKGDAVAIGKLKDYLDKALTDQNLKAEVEPIVQEIHQTIVQFDDIIGRNVQQVSGGQGLQVNDPNAPVIQAGDNANFNFNYGKD